MQHAGQLPGAEGRVRPRGGTGAPRRVPPGPRPHIPYSHPGSPPTGLPPHPVSTPVRSPACRVRVWSPGAGSMPGNTACRRARGECPGTQLPASTAAVCWLLRADQRPRAPRSPRCAPCVVDVLALQLPAAPRRRGRERESRQHPGGTPRGYRAHHARAHTHTHAVRSPTCAACPRLHAPGARERGRHAPCLVGFSLYFGARAGKDGLGPRTIRFHGRDGFVGPCTKRHERAWTGSAVRQCRRTRDGSRGRALSRGGTCHGCPDPAASGCGASARDTPWARPSRMLPTPGGRVRRRRRAAAGRTRTRSSF
jgi:hypothetical protein